MFAGENEHFTGKGPASWGELDTLKRQSPHALFDLAFVNVTDRVKIPMPGIPCLSSPPYECTHHYVFCCFEDVCLLALFPRLEITSQTPSFFLSPPGNPKSYRLLWANQLLDDSMCESCLIACGADVVELNLHNTFITESSLSALRNCPNLTRLHLSACRNIRDKTVANETLAPVLGRMVNLTELVIADSCISGRALLESPRQG
jgi:hypothetical protein